MRWIGMCGWGRHLPSSYLQALGVGLQRRQGRHFAAAAQHDDVAALEFVVFVHPA